MRAEAYKLYYPNLWEDQAMNDENNYPSIEAMKAAVELEIHAALGTVQTVVIGRMIQKAIDATSPQALAATPAVGGEGACAVAAWQWRACINGNWGSWMFLPERVDHFRKVNQFNLDNGTYELRPLFATQPASPLRGREELARKKAVEFISSHDPFGDVFSSNDLALIEGNRS